MSQDFLPKPLNNLHKFSPSKITNLDFVYRKDLLKNDKENEI